MTLILSRHDSVIDSAHRLNEVNILQKFIENLSKASGDMERTRNVTDGQMDRRTDGRTDEGLFS